MSKTTRDFIIPRPPRPDDPNYLERLERWRRAMARALMERGENAADDVANLQDQIDDLSSSFLDHSARHENGGSDEINVTGLSGELADPQPPKAHANTHGYGANDALTVTHQMLDTTNSPSDGQVLSYEAANAKMEWVDQSGGSSNIALFFALRSSRVIPIMGAAVGGVPESHAFTHQNGGSDEIDVTGLSGELADPQPPKAHALGGAEHTADTLANLNAKISDATLDDSSQPRDPKAHANTHESGGSDAINASNLFPSLYNNGNSSNSFTINWANSKLQLLTLTANCTISWANATSGRALMLELKQDATGGRTVTWPASVKWEGGSAPTLSTSANAIDILTFFSDGTNQFGQVYGKGFA